MGELLAVVPTEELPVDALSRPEPPPASTAGADILVAESLSKTYHSRSTSVVALEAVSFGVAEGEFVSLVGPSGCGKSTLLKMVAGLLEPSSGRVAIDGATVIEPRDDVGLMLQTPTLFPWRTVGKNVALPFDIRRRRVRDLDARIAKVLRMVGLEGVEGRYPRQLSGGMQQRVALCRLLIVEPRLLLLDEPFGALDEFTRERLNLELAAITEQQHKSVLLVTHNVSEAVFLSDRVFVMGADPGRLIGIVDIDLPRPRRAALLAGDAHSHFVRTVRSMLGIG